MSVIDDLLVILGFQANTDGADRFDNRLGRTIKVIGSVGAAAISGGAIVAGGMAAMAISTANAIDETQRLAKVASVTTQELQYLTAGAERYGIEQDKLSDILKDVGDKTGDFIAAGGGAMKDFFDNIGNKVGVTAKQFKGLSGAQALQLYYSTLEKANVSQAEMTFYMEALASDATMLIPLLENGGQEFKKWGEEAKAAGRIMSDSDLAANTEFVDNISRAKNVYEGLIARMTQKARPFINEAMEWVISHEAEIMAAADQVATVFGNIIDFLADHKAEIKAFAIGIGDAFMLAVETIKQAYNAISQALAWINENSEKIKSTLTTVGIVAAVIAGALTIMYAPVIAGFLLMQAIGLLSFIMLAAAAISSAAATAAAWIVAFAPFLLIAALVAAAIFAFWYLYNNWAQVTALLKAAGASAIDFIKLKIAELGAWFSSKIDGIKSAWSNFWSSAGAIAGGAIDTVIGKIQSVISFLTNALSKVKDLSSYSPMGLASKASGWIKGQMGGGGNTSNSTNSVHQTINVKSAAEAASVARNSINSTRNRNTGVTQ